MDYPIIIHKDKYSDYGVTVPDLPGCFSAGHTVDEALAMAKEAIELHLEGIIEDGELVPDASPIQKLKDDPAFRNGIWAIVSINESSLRIAAKRVNVTIPERILDAIDSYAKEHHETRSGLVVKATTTYIKKAQMSRARPGRNKKSHDILKASHAKI